MKPKQKTMFDEISAYFESGPGNVIKGKLPRDCHVTYSNYVSGIYFHGKEVIEKTPAWQLHDDSHKDEGRIIRGPEAKRIKISPFMRILFEQQKSVTKLIQEGVMPDYEPKKPNDISKVWRGISRRIKKIVDDETDIPFLALQMVSKLVLTSAYLTKKEISFLVPTLMDVLKAGGIPVGWVGNFPEGEIAVYWQHDQEPKFKG